MARLEKNAAVPAVLPVHRDLYYAGGWHPSHSGEREAVINPGTGEAIGTVAEAGPDDVDAAVAAAHAAFLQWRRAKPTERAVLLRKCAAVLRTNAEDLALIDAIDSGNPVREMARDAIAAAQTLEFFAGLVGEIKGFTVPLEPGALHYTIREPLGVVAKIIAFNHPLLFAASKIAAPLAAGNTVIVKPPEQAPLSSLRMAELFHDIFPPGVLSVLPGGRECGAALSGHPRVAKVGLIGSVPTGKAILRSAADTLKPVSLELGGKNALIAFPDADPDIVAGAIMRGMNFTWCGQSCGSTSRALVHTQIYDRVMQHIVEKIRDLKPGNPADPATTMGAIISAAQHERVMKYIAWGREDGARLVYGGKRPDDPALAGGFFVEPTVFADVTPDMRIAREEIFGPVLSVMRWTEREKMIAVVNDLEYGLTCSIWTNDLAAAHETSAAVDAGYVWINDVGAHYLGMPFGGVKQSGLGREETLDELLDCTRIKAVNLRMRMA